MYGTYFHDFHDDLRSQHTKFRRILEILRLQSL